MKAFFKGRNYKKYPAPVIIQARNRWRLGGNYLLTFKTYKDMKATSLIISEIESKGFITEKEINLLRRRANAGDKEAANFWPCVECTPEQSEKGFLWLKNLYKTPNGKERRNNPFGYREMSIIDNYNGELFEFKGFYDAGRYGFHNYLPVYGFNGMEYYVCGEIQIVG